MRHNHTGFNVRAAVNTIADLRNIQLDIANMEYFLRYFSGADHSHVFAKLLALKEKEKRLLKRVGGITV